MVNFEKECKLTKQDRSAPSTWNGIQLVCYVLCLQKDIFCKDSVIFAKTMVLYCKKIALCLQRDGSTVETDSETDYLYWIK